MKQTCTHEEDPHLMSSPPPPTHVTGLPFCFLCSSSTDVQPDASLLQLLCIKIHGVRKSIGKCRQIYSTAVGTLNNDNLPGISALMDERQRLTVNDSDNLGGDRCRLLLPVTLRYSLTFSSREGFSGASNGDRLCKHSVQMQL